VYPLVCYLLRGPFFSLFKPLKKMAHTIRTGAGLLLTALLLTGCDHMPLLYPKGPIGEDERFLILTALGLMLIVVIPVLVMAFWFSRTYRASNTRADYQPKWDHSTTVDLFIWLVPLIIVIVLSYLTWTETYRLDPYKPIESGTDPIPIDVVSLDWKWLFIYPDQGIATVNQLVFPAGVPLSFRLTSDTVMTSFFIPRLGSQMYAMAGMQTSLNLMADEPGTYVGQNQEFSGHGYSGMHFKAVATTPQQFQTWIEQVQRSPDKLDLTRYGKLIEPTSDVPVIHFATVMPGLFEKIMGKYMGWMGERKDMDMKGMGMDPMNTGPSNKAIEGAGAASGHPGEN
jgi:cytochrome o ubiquinol oxidase subunit II